MKVIILSLDGDRQLCLLFRMSPVVLNRHSPGTLSAFTATNTRDVTHGWLAAANLLVAGYG